MPEVFTVRLMIVPSDGVCPLLSLLDSQYDVNLAFDYVGLSGTIKF